MIPGWAALLAGVLIALIANPRLQLKAWTTRSLQAGVVALGAGMRLPQVVRAGVDGFAITAIGIAATLVLGFVLARVLGLRRHTALLLSVGTAICGGSAIAAVASVVQPEPEETSVSLAVVFVLNAAALFIAPLFYDLPAAHFGRFVALAIHDTSSVVGAAMGRGPEALDIATTTKLARALWIVPLTLAIALHERKQALGRVKWPWFIGLFVLVAALDLPYREHIVTVGRWLLVAALFLVGLSLNRETLKKVGPRPLLHGVVLWLSAGALSFVLAR